MSDSVASLAGALAAAQSEMENATKNAQNPHFRNRYADLAEVLNTVRPVLAKHGIAVLQSPSYSDGIATVETLLMHSSGEWVRGAASAPVVKTDPQGVGSATTYLRRYALAALCGIAQEDDDGEASVRKAEPKRSKPVVADKETESVTPDQRALLEKLLRSHVVTEAERGKMHKSLANGLSKARAQTAIDKLMTTIADRKAIEREQAEDASYGA